MTPGTQRWLVTCVRAPRGSTMSNTVDLSKPLPADIATPRPDGGGTGTSGPGNQVRPAIPFAVPDDLAMRRKAVEDEVQLIYDWYRSARTRKKRPALLVRWLVIFSFSAATILPILAAITKADLLPWSSVAAAFAAVMIAFDKFTGLSSGWIRYITAMLDIDRRWVLFELEWDRTIAGADADDVKAAKLRSAIESFYSDVKDVERTETRTWIDEFKAAGGELEKVLAERQKMLGSQTTGAIKVSIANIAELDGGLFKVELESQSAPAVCSDPEYVATAIQPGLCKIRISATKKGNAVARQDCVQVDAGKVTVAGPFTL